MRASSNQIHAAIVEITGMSSVNVELIHNGICWIDQFIIEWPSKPEPNVRMSSHTQFDVDGQDRS